LGRVIATTTPGREFGEEEKGEMNPRFKGTQVWGARVLSAALTLAPLAIFATLTSYAQVNGRTHASSASHVAAEMTKGKLNPAENKPGDTVAVKLKDDIRSNGEVILKKGATLTGVVRSVKCADATTDSKVRAVSMMEIEWLAPAVQSRAGQSLSFALQSVTQVNPITQHEQSESFGKDFALAGGGSSSAASSAVARPAHSSSGAGLLGATGAIAANATNTTGTGSPAGTPTDGVVSAAGEVASTSSSAAGRSNVALLSMPSVVAVDEQTSSSIESTLGTSLSGQLFRVGHGELISAGGSKQSIDLYSHLSNDTVITSPGKNFEISSGAQMQMLVGVNRK
jgi:hypothetical protein